MKGIAIYHLRLKDDTENLQTTFARTRLEHWLSRYADCPEAYEIAKETVDRLADQKITVPGQMIGYQFARHKWGTRTVKRTVYNLHYDEAGGLFGHIQVLSRLVLVKYDQWLVMHQRTRVDSEAKWASIKWLDRAEWA